MGGFWIRRIETWVVISFICNTHPYPPPPTHTLAWCFREKERKELLTSCSYSAVKLGKGFSLKQKEGKCASSEHTQILVHVFSYLRQGSVFSHSNTLRTDSGGWPGAQGLSAAGVGHQSCFGPLWGVSLSLWTLPHARLNLCLCAHGSWGSVSWAQALWR